MTTNQYPKTNPAAGTFSWTKEKDVELIDAVAAVGAGLSGAATACLQNIVWNQVKIRVGCPHLPANIKQHFTMLS